VPALRLRATEEEEALGIDDVEIGEFAVSHHWFPSVNLRTKC
jgi:Amt family ammonium transporter